MKKSLKIAIIVVIMSSRVYAQTEKVIPRLGFYAGFSLSDLFHAGVTYRWSQSQAGLNFSTFPDNDPNRVSTILGISTVYYKHLLGKSDLTTLRPWYVKGGITYWYRSSHHKDRYHDYHTKYIQVLARLHIGRDFNITNKLGVNFSLGIQDVVYWNDVLPPAPERGYFKPLWPSADIAFYYRP